MGNQMGQTPKKLIAIQNLSQQISKCQQISERKCPIYGTLHTILYQGIQFEIGKSIDTQIPHEKSLHHLIRPNILVIPPHYLLENFKLSKYERKKQLFQIIFGICDIAISFDVGFSHNRVAFSQFTKQWCIIGDLYNGLWNYQAIFQNSVKKGLYLSPELMIAYSKQKPSPKIDIKQSDVFILAIMLMQIISQAQLQPKIYNFADFQIKLGPILQALVHIQENLGRDVYELFVKMLQLDPQSRITFQQLKKQITKNISRQQQQFYLSPINVKLSDFTSPANNPKPKQDSFSPSPQIRKSNIQDQNKGRSPGVIKKNLPLTDRQNGKKSFSPIKPVQTQISAQADDCRNSLLCNQRKKKPTTYKITPNRVKIWQGIQKQRSKVEPFGLKLDANLKEQNSDNQKSSFIKLKTMRF